MGRLNRADLAVPRRQRRSAELIEGRSTSTKSIAQLLAGLGENPRGSERRGDDLQEWEVDQLTDTITCTANRFLATPIEADSDFFDGGATSVAAVELVAALQREHGIRLELDDVFADARPRQLARQWLRNNGRTVPAASPSPTPAVPALSADAGDREVDDTLRQLISDVARADSLPFVGPPNGAKPKRILLTGVTGFLGSHMLLDLLRHSDAHVVCLVRADDEDQALGRIADSLRKFHLPWSREVARRITALPGDFRLPQLGLSPTRWESLAEEVDSIVNVGAAVDFLRGYSSLRQSNVMGPLTLAELAMTGQVKPLHHISSVAVFNELGVTRMGEDDPVAHIDRLAAGYDQTKWAAEAVLRRAREHGLVVTILRPAGIGGHPDSGAHNRHDFSSAFVATHSRFGTMPAFRYLNVAAVDWVSRVATAIACEPNAWGYNYHLTGIPRSFDEVMRDMSIAGMAPRIQHWEDWKTDTVARIRKEPVPELEFLARMLESPTASQLCQAQLTAPAALCERTMAFINQHGLPAPTPYDGTAQRRTYEQLAATGLARLPHSDEGPYLAFSETLRGCVTAPDGTGDHECALALQLSIDSMYQLITERRIDVNGQLTCIALHPKPLTIESGSMWIRPDDGIPLRNDLRHPLMRYRLLMRDMDGQQWWFEGTKFARAHRDLLRQTRTLTVEVGRADEPAAFVGEVAVPVDTYLHDQIDGLRVNRRLSDRDQRRAKLIWLAWFNFQVGRGLLEPQLRVVTDLFDLRRGATSKEQRR